MSKSYTKLLTDIKNQQVDSLILVPERREVIVIYNNGKKEIIPIFLDDQLILRTAEQNSIPLIVKDLKQEQQLASFLSITGVLFIFIFGTLFILKKSNDLINSTFNTSKKFDPTIGEESSNIRFDDIAGLDSIISELNELVSFLKNPNKLKDLGAIVPKGILLEGPPGTGKTLLARAIANEANVPFFSITGSDFVELFVGLGASRVRALFNNARTHLPCIIFIDEIDAVGRKRGSGIGIGNDEREQTLNQLLSEMDGFQANSGLIVVAATNRSEYLDEALSRPGRFDRKIQIDMPNLKSRLRILGIHSRSVPLENNVDLSKIALKTPGYSGADLKNIINEAAIKTAIKNESNITQLTLESALDKISVGINHSRKHHYNLLVAAYRLSGKIIVSQFVEPKFVIDKVSILPTTKYTNGYIKFIDESEDIDNGLLTKKYIMSKIKILLAARSAENIIFGEKEITQASESDLVEVRILAKTMVTKFGLSQLPPVYINYNDSNTILGNYFSKGKSKYSQQTKRMIDKQIRLIAIKQLKFSELILNKNKEALKVIASNLLENETLYSYQINNILENSNIII